MASIAHTKCAQRRVTFKGDNVDALMKPPCETLKYDKNAPVAHLRKPVAKSPGPKLTRSKRAWVPRRLRQKMAEAEAKAAEEKKTKPKKKVSFCPTAKLYDLDLYEHGLREMEEEELEELERQQMKLDGWVNDMCNPYNY